MPAGGNEHEERYEVVESIQEGVRGEVQVEESRQEFQVAMMSRLRR